MREMERELKILLNAYNSGSKLSNTEYTAYLYGGLDELKSLVKLLKGYCRCMGGQLYIARCSICHQFQISPYVFCPSCSKDSSPVPLFTSCQEACWANPSFLEKHKQEFTVKDHLFSICSHVSCRPIDGTEFKSALECVVGVCISDFFSDLVGCTRSDIALHTAHCINTHQISYLTSLNKASNLCFLGEFELGNMILEYVKNAVPVNRMENPTGTVFMDFFSSNEDLGNRGLHDPMEEELRVNDSRSTNRNCPAQRGSVNSQDTCSG